MIKMINAHDSNVCVDINQNLTENYKMKMLEGNGKIQIFKIKYPRYSSKFKVALHCVSNFNHDV